MPKNVFLSYFPYWITKNMKQRVFFFLQNFVISDWNLKKIFSLDILAGSNNDHSQSNILQKKRLFGSNFLPIWDSLLNMNDIFLLLLLTINYEWIFRHDNTNWLESQMFWYCPLFIIDAYFNT